MRRSGLLVNFLKTNENNCVQQKITWAPITTLERTCTHSLQVKLTVKQTWWFKPSLSQWNSSTKHLALLNLRAQRPTARWAALSTRSKSLFSADHWPLKQDHHKSMAGCFQESLWNGFMSVACCPFTLAFWHGSPGLQLPWHSQTATSTTYFAKPGIQGFVPLPIPPLTPSFTMLAWTVHLDVNSIYISLNTFCAFGRSPSAMTTPHLTTNQKPWKQNISELRLALSTR